MLPVFCQFYVKTGTLLLNIKIDNTEPEMLVPEELLSPESPNVEFEIIDQDTLEQEIDTSENQNDNEKLELKFMSSEKVIV